MSKVERDPSSSDLARERMFSGSMPLERSDPYKFGLILPGGAMASGYMLGMVLALGRHHVTSVFDSIYGISAGAVAGAYLLARQPEAIRIFYEDINNKDFINKRRYPIVDINYLDYVMKEKRPLYWERVVNSRIPLNICITEFSKSGVRTVISNEFGTRDELLGSIIDSCRMPFATGDPREVSEGVYYTDGVVSTGGISIQEAIDDGCTHLLVVQPHPDGYGEKNVPSTRIERLASMMLYRKYPMLAQAIMEINRRYAGQLREIKRAERSSSYFPVRIEGMRVHSSNPINDILTIDSDTLKKAITTGYRTGSSWSLAMMNL